MKKFKKDLIMFVLVFVFIFSLTSCKVVDNNTKNSEIEDDINKIGVIINEASPHNTYSSLAEMIADVKETVVDVYAYSVSATSAGSGVIIGNGDSYYYIITNHHVISDATSFQVVTNLSDDNETYEATLIGGSPSNDIAVLAINTDKELKTATFIKDSDTVKVGEEVVAIGNPLGILGGTVTRGIISATARNVYIENIGYMSLLQTDASINSGNSGGALFNTEGLLVGIVNSGYTSYEGLNFAIPANQAKTAFTSLVETYSAKNNTYGYVKGEANLGITLAESTIYASSSLNSQVKILYAKSALTTGDAYKNNFKDYTNFANGKYNTFYAITKINGTAVNSIEDASTILNSVKATETLTITYREVKYINGGMGFFGTAYYYLSGEEKDINIYLTQYVYNPTE